MSKFFAKFVLKKQVADQTFLTVFKTSEKSNFNPGQFASIQLQKGQRRSYSYVDICQKPPVYLATDLPDLTDKDEYYHIFLISTKSVNGLTAQTIQSAIANQEFEFLSPLGQFCVSKDVNQTKVFVCTGTGVAPFIPMIKQILTEGLQTKVYLFFGTSADIGNYAQDFFAEFNQNPNFKFYTGMFPVEVEAETEFVLNGTVTQILPKIIKNLNQAEYYICGNPFMVQDVKQLLINNQVTNIYTENFGSPAASLTKLG